jgi:hypothetical protein
MPRLAILALQALIKRGEMWEKWETLIHEWVNDERYCGYNASSWRGTVQHANSVLPRQVRALRTQSGCAMFANGSAFDNANQFVPLLVQSIQKMACTAGI